MNSKFTLKTHLQNADVKRNDFKNIKLILLLMGYIMLMHENISAQFTSGRLVVLRAGDGVATLVNTGNPMSLDEFTTTGSAGFSVTMPSTGLTPLIIGGTSGTEGQISRSPDKTKITVQGYAQALPNATALSSSTAATINRAIGVVDYSGSFTRVATSASNFSGSSPRGCATDGLNNYWGTGGATGVVYWGTASAAATASTAKTNNRGMLIHNGQLYISSGSAAGTPANTGIFSVGTGLPVTSGQTMSTVINLTGIGTGAAGPNAFYFNSTSTICYVADDRTTANGGGIQRFNFVSGSWVYQYTLTTTTGCIGVVADFSGTGPVVYATTTETSNNKIIKFTDTGAGSVATVLVSAGTNKVFRGIAFSPENPCTPPTLSTTTTPSCSNGNTGSVTLSVSGGTLPYTYLWSNASTNQNQTNAAPGTYTVTVTDNTGCATSTSTEVGSIAAPTPSITGNLSFCTGGSTTLSTQTFSTYLWSNSSTDQSITANSAGTYTVTVSDGTCTATASTVVTVNPNPSPSISGNTTVCGAGSTTLTASSGFAAYLWSNSETNQSVSVSTTGTYTVTVTDGNGCTGSTSVQVTVSANLSPSITGVVSFCSGGSTTLSTQTYTSYLWSNSETTQSTVVNIAGTYTVTVSDGICTGTATISVVENTPPTVTISGNTSICFLSNTTLDAGAGYSNYTWSNGITTQTNIVSTAGTFTVTVTDNNGCTGSASVTTTVFPNFSVTTTATNAVHCEGESSTINAFGAVTFTWAPAAGLNQTTGSSVIASPASTTIYTVTGTNANGCTKIAARKITVVAVPVAPTVTSPLTYCQNATATALTATANPAHHILMWYNVPTGGTGSPIAPVPSTASAGTTSYYVSQVAGGLQVGIIGWIDNASTDLFSMVALADIPAGTDIYFTDNGWTGTLFRGASATDRDGNETIVKFTSINTINAGAIIESYSASADYVWTSSGPVDPAFPSGGVFAPLSLAQGGDQIYAFTASDPLNPLFTPLKHLFVFDDTNGFEPSTSAATGDVPPGLSVAVGNAATFPATFGSANLISLNNDGISRTVDEWYLYISNALNYTLETAVTVTGTLPSGNLNMLASCESARSQIDVNILPAPAINISSNSPVCSGSTLTLNSNSGHQSYAWTGPNGFTSSINNPSIVNASSIHDGTYVVTVTGLNGCTATDSLIVTVNPLPVISFSGLPTTICKNEAAVTLTSNQSGGLFTGAGITDNANGTASFNPVTANSGNHQITFTYTDGNGCSNTTSQSVTVYDAPDIQAIAAQSNTCPSNSFDLSSITLVNNGATGAVTYHALLADAQSGSNTISSTVNTTGTYYIRITTANGCFDFEAVSVTINSCGCPNPPTANAGANFSICANQNAVLNGNIGGGAGTATWSGGNGIFTPNATTLNASYTPSSGEITSGFVTLTLTTDDPDAGGPCVAAVSSVTTTIHALPSVSVTPASTSICAGSSININATGTGTFSWSPAASLNASTGTSVIATPAANEIYTVTITDNNNCTNSATSSISINNLPSIGASANPATICSGNTSSLSATGGDTYAWSPAVGLNQTTGSTVTATLTSATTYTVTGTDLNGCSSTATVIVNVNALPAVSISGAANFCSNSTEILDAGSGFVSYLWNDGSTNQTLTINTGGTYTVTVTDANGCSNSNSKTVGIYSPPSVSGSSANALCNGGLSGSIDLTATGGNPCGVNSPGLLISKVYTNPSGSDSPFEWVELVATKNINFSITPYTVIVANNGTGNVNGWLQGGNVTYAFQITTGTATTGGVYYVGGSSMIPASNQLRTINTGTTAGDGGLGNFNIGGVFGNGGTNGDGVAVFEGIVSGLTASSVPVDAVFYGSAIGTALVSGGTQGYQLPLNDLYSGGKLQAGSFFTLDQGGSNLYLNATGTFNMATSSFVSPRTFTNNAIGVFVDGVSSVTLTGVAPYTYNWSNGATTEDLAGVGAGTYTVTVSDCNGCTATASFTITEPSTITTSASITNIICNGGSDGALDLTATGGTGTLSFVWEDASTDEDRNNLAAGIYSVTVTDANNCSATQTFTITQPNAATVSYALGNVTCKNTATGFIDLTVVSPASPFTFMWNNGNTNEDRTNLPSGNYTVTITDANNCSITQAFSVTQPATAVTVSMNKTNIRCGNKSNGVATALPTGGVSPYSYSWDNGSTTASISGLAAGTYTVTVTDAAGCSKTKSVIITSNPAITVLIIPSGSTATAMPSGGVSPYTYLWNTAPGQTTATATGLVAGNTYKVRVTDSKNCTMIAQIVMPLPKVDALNETTVTVFPNPNNGLFSIELSNTDFKKVQIQVSDALGRLVYNQQINFEKTKTNIDLSHLPKGIYILSVEHEKGKNTTRLIIE